MATLYVTVTFQMWHLTIKIIVLSTQVNLINMYCVIKCKKCRKPISDGAQTKELFLNAHSSPLGSSPEECASIQEENNIFLSEEFLPQWIILRIESERWSKGRLNCPSCDSRIGGFDFVSGQKCGCSSHVLPPVHIIKSKVDLLKANNWSKTREGRIINYFENSIQRDNKQTGNCIVWEEEFKKKGPGIVSKVYHEAR